MYCSYWQLNELPFESDGDLSRYVDVPEAADVRLKLRYLHDHRKAGGVLVGESGVGKSYLVRQFAADVRQQDGDAVRPIVRLVYPRLKPAELVATLAVRLGADPTEADSRSVGLDRLLDLFGQQLHGCHADRSPILILDDAHTIDDPDVWRTLRLLMNFREEDGGRFSLLLLGQNELLGRLGEHPELADRLPVRASVASLSEASVATYVQTRLTAAGTRADVFDDDAIAELTRLSTGVPRRINDLADLSLLVGMADQFTTVSAESLRAAENEMRVPSGR